MDFRNHCIEKTLYGLTRQRYCENSDRVRTAGMAPREAVIWIDALTCCIRFGLSLAVKDEQCNASNISVAPLHEGARRWTGIIGNVTG